MLSVLDISSSVSVIFYRILNFVVEKKLKRIYHEETEGRPP